jgi:protein SCO1/2
MEFSHWRQEIYAGQKILLGCKIGQAKWIIRYGAYRKFCLVDTKKRVRGFYDGTNKEDIKRLIEDITF